MRLIDVEPLECVVSITPKGVDAKSYNEGYKDALELMDKQPTIAAVPIKAISAWLAAYAAPPKYAIDEIAGTDPDRILTVDTLVKAWEYHWKYLMECGLIVEGLDADRP